MHGLNTVQQTNFITPISQQTTVSGNAGRYWNETSVDAPATLRNLLTTWSSTDQYYIKRLYNTVYYTNVCLMPVMVDIWHLKLRKDNDIDVLPSMAVGAPNPLSPYQSPMTGDLFRRQYKILKHKSKILYPQKLLRLTIKSSIPYRKAGLISSTMDGDLSYVHRANNKILMVSFSGIPINGVLAATPATDGTVISPFMVRGLVHQYISYYSLNDIQPTSSTIGTGLPLSYVEANTATNPTYAQVALTTVDSAKRMVPTYVRTTVPPA